MNMKLISFAALASLSIFSQAVTAKECVFPSALSKEDMLKIKQEKPTVKIVKTFKFNVNGSKVDAYQVASEDYLDETWNTAKITEKSKKSGLLAKIAAKDLAKLDLYFMNTGTFLVPKGYKVAADLVASEYTYSSFINENGNYVAYYRDGYIRGNTPILRALFPEDANIKAWDKISAEVSPEEAKDQCTFDVSKVKNAKYISKTKVNYDNGELFESVSYQSSKYDEESGQGGIRSPHFATYKLGEKEKGLLPIMFEFNDK